MAVTLDETIRNADDAQRVLSILFYSGDPDELDDEGDDEDEFDDEEDDESDDEDDEDE